MFLKYMYTEHIHCSNNFCWTVVGIKNCHILSEASLALQNCLKVLARYIFSLYQLYSLDGDGACRTVLNTVAQGGGTVVSIT